MRNTETKIYRIYVHTYAFLHCAQTMSGLNKRDKDKSIKENKYTNGLYMICKREREFYQNTSNWVLVLIKRHVKDYI